MAKAKKPLKPSKNRPPVRLKAKVARPSRRPSQARETEIVEAEAEVSRSPAGRAFPIEIDPRAIEATLARLREEAVHWANKGRYTRVRFKFRGKQLLPDLPLAAVVAAEGLTFYWGGILRALLMNAAGKSVLDVEFVNDSEKLVQKGKEELLSGNLDQALAHFREAIAMDRDSAQGHLNLGVALKLKGDFAGARAALSKAVALGKDSPLAAEAERLIKTLPQETSLTAPRRDVSSDAPPTH